MPARHLEGEVTVNVLRGADTISTVKGAPGEVKTLDDETPKSDEFVYTFVSANNLGESKSATVTKLVGMDWAKPITDVTIEEVADGVVKIDWVNPTEDNSGHSLGRPLLHPDQIVGRRHQSMGRPSCRG